MVLLYFGEHFARGLIRANLARDLLEPILVMTKIGVGNGAQPVEGDIDHFVVKQLLAKRVGAKPEVTFRDRQKIFPQKVLVFEVSINHLLVGGLKFGEQPGILDRAEGCGDIVTEEVRGTWQLLERDFGVDTRRVHEIVAGGVEDSGNLPLARNHRAEAFAGRREIAFHNQENTVGGAAAVKVRIFPAAADRKSTRLNSSHL